jgi:peptidoglycan/xylan/chitin deacetylase (PgdA/CDA1 family)
MDETTVCVTYDFDAVSAWLASDMPGYHAWGAFGAETGAPRLLELHERLDVPATWFVPGHTIETFPDECWAIREDGHEIGHHGYRHESPRALGAAEEIAVLERGSECIRKLTGEYPAGYRAPGWDPSANTISLLRERGFLYDSSLMGDDFEPYYARAGDHQPPDGPFLFGERVPLVELPVDWCLDDWPYFQVNWPSHHVGLRPGADVFEVWRQEFAWFFRRQGRGVFTLTLHPQVIGRGHRLLLLERFLEHVNGHEGVRFATMREVAEEWRTANPFSPASRR